MDRLLDNFSLPRPLQRASDSTTAARERARRATRAWTQRLWHL